jgi:hypothetical protein
MRLEITQKQKRITIGINPQPMRNEKLSKQARSPASLSGELVNFESRRAVTERSAWARRFRVGEFVQDLPLWIGAAPLQLERERFIPFAIGMSVSCGVEKQPFPGDTIT